MSKRINRLCSVLSQCDDSENCFEKSFHMTTATRSDYQSSGGIAIGNYAALVHWCQVSSSASAPITSKKAHAVLEC